MRPGRYVIEIVDEDGPVRGPEVDMIPCRLVAKIVSTSPLILDLDVDSHPMASLSIRASDERMPASEATQLGTWWLRGEQPGRPAGRTELPFRIDNLNLIGVEGKTDAQGKWHGRFEMPRHSPSVHVQGVAWFQRDNAAGFVTNVVTLAVPK